MITLNGKPINVTMFPDKTSQVWKLPEEDLQLRSAKLRWEFESEAEVMHLVQTRMLLRACGVDNVELEIDYLPYARQDKPISNDATFALHALISVLSCHEWSLITVIDPHSDLMAERIFGEFRCVLPVGRMHEAARAVGAECIAFPDANAAMKYGELFTGYQLVSGHKTREPGTGEITRYALGVREAHATSWESVLIVDDICDGGATFVALAGLLRSAGAKHIHLFVSHGLFTKGLEPLRAAGIERIWTKNGEVK